VVCLAPLSHRLTDRLKAHLDGLSLTEGLALTEVKGARVNHPILAEAMRPIKNKMKHQRPAHKVHEFRKNATIEPYWAGRKTEAQGREVKGSTAISKLQ